MTENDFEITIVKGLLPPLPWHPESGAGVEVANVGGRNHLAIICPHQLLVDAIDHAPEAMRLFGEIHPECPITWVRQYFEPARDMARMFGNIMFKPGAPYDVVGFVDQVHVLAAMVGAYLDANPPEACGCDPGLELVYQIGSSAPSVLKTCHEDGCAYVGRKPAGPPLRMSSPVARA